MCAKGSVTRDLCVSCIQQDHTRGVSSQNSAKSSNNCAVIEESTKKVEGWKGEKEDEDEEANLILSRIKSRVLT